MPHTTVLIPDGECYHLIAVLQSFSKVKGYRLVVLSEKKWLPMRFSRITSRFIYIPPGLSDKDWAALLNRNMQTHSADVVLPLSEACILRLIRVKELLDMPGRMLLPESEALLNTARHKGLLALHLKDCGLPTPETWELPLTGNPFPDAEALRYPVLAKPTGDAGGGIGIVRLTSAEELQRFIAQGPDPDAYILQQEVDGDDFGCNVLCRDGEILAHTIQKGRLFSAKPFAPQVGLEFIEIDAVFQLVSRLMRSLRWNGVANVDLRYNTKEQAYQILEINPRYWLTLIASTAAGMNFPILYCKAVTGKGDFPQGFYQMDYLTPKGILLTIQKRPLTLLQWGYLWKHAPISFYLRDPGMTLALMVLSVLKRSQSLFRKITSKRTGATSA